MWSRLTDRLSCPVCYSQLRVDIFAQEFVSLSDDDWALASMCGMRAADFNCYIESGLLVCSNCKIYFPITHGLPIMVPYTTPIHHEFSTEFNDRLTKYVDYRFADSIPVSGEEFVMDSFSAEWLAYEYDGIIWDLSYEDHEKRLLSEIGPEALGTGRNGTFLEVGCGIGLSTFFAAKNMECDAIGIDLSLAVLVATKYFRNNPFLHFIQASAFSIPLRKNIADVIYTHGVLHHTYSTELAVKAVGPHCREDGWMYVWLYGSGSKGGSMARRIAFHLEEAMRPRIARNLASRASRAALGILACAYLLVNKFHRMNDPTVEKYDYGKALHAARDRFTPLYAHRQDYAEVAAWFADLGFEDIVEVDWRTMPTANQDNYRRNTGVRGRRQRSPQVITRNLVT
jgi:SAM-dependent methyltransferase